MSDAIKQLHASYSSFEDRVLFTIETQNNNQILAWMTRRYLKLLFPILQGQHPIMGSPIKSKLPAIETEQKTIELTEKKAETQAETQASKNEIFIHPIGDNPILLTKISFRDFETEHPLLLLEPETGEGIVFGYNPDFLSTLLQLLSKSIEKSGWEFNSEFITQVPEKVVLQ